MEKENEYIKRVVDYLVFQISRRFPMVDLIYPLLELCYEIPLKDTRKIYFFLTDGEKLYVNPSVLAEYQKNPVKIEILFLHQLLHIILGHPVGVTESDRETYDPLCDRMVLGWLKELYGEYCTHDILRLRNGFVFMTPDRGRLEEHDLWYRKQEKEENQGSRDMGDSKNQEDGTGGMGEEQGAEQEEGQGAEGEQQYFFTKKRAEEIWKEIQNITMVMNDPLSSENTAYGMGSGYGGSASYMKSVRSVSDIKYQEILREYIEVKEVDCAVNDELDPMLYSYGLTLYEDIPFVEAPETIDFYVAKFFIAIDTSGSCHSEMLENFLGQTKYVLEELSKGGKQELDIYLFLCDSKIEQEFHITCMGEFPKPSELRITGGGTDFRPVFTRIREIRKNADGADYRALFYYTDGCGRFPDGRPEVDTFFLMEKQDMGIEDIPEWVKKVEI